jgi:hypothetical protein
LKPVWLVFLTFAAAACAQVAQLRSTFEVRYVANGAVYVSGGREEGLQEGFRLVVKRLKPGEPTLSAQQVAELTVSAVAAHSAVCDIVSSTAELETGDIAEVSSDDLESLRMLQQSRTARNFAQIVSFTEGDPLEQEQRDYVPRPPSPEVNRARGRISYEFDTIRDHGAGLATDQNGVVLRADVTRIGGSYWNFTGYWRGRVNSRYSAASQQQTLRDLLNRTYHIGIFYNNPQSNYIIGAGRLFVPWAPSLSTIDGAYLGRRLSRRVTVGAFGGSTPDPTAWNYKPGRQIAGTFANLEVGRFESVRFIGTAGIAMTRLNWKAEREFTFAETNLLWKQYIAVFHSLEADRLVPGRLGNTESGVALARSFLTVRVQPRRWLAIDFNHNYFRTIPTFDTLLLGTGLLDKYLFAGLSMGLRVDVPRGISLYGNVGQNKRSDDPRGSLNQMYGIAFRNVAGTGMRVDIRRSEFHGAFGNGWYQSVSVSREVGERLRFEVQGGEQEFRSPVSADNRGFWMNTSMEWFLSRHYVFGSGLSLFRGELQNYDQTFISLGYRF